MAYDRADLPFTQRRYCKVGSIASMELQDLVLVKVWRHVCLEINIYRRNKVCCHSEHVEVKRKEEVEFVF